MVIECPRSDRTSAGYQQPRENWLSTPLIRGRTGGLGCLPLESPVLSTDYVAETGQQVYVGGFI